MTNPAPPLDASADGNGARLSDPMAPARLIHQMSKIDRIDNKGDIHEHLTRDGHRTICGIEIGQIAARCQIVARAASGEQSP